jgi:hypothetical protein
MYSVRPLSQRKKGICIDENHRRESREELPKNLWKPQNFGIAAYLKQPRMAS